MDEKIVIYTDGACSGNPGVGGWGALILKDGNCQQIKENLARIDQENE